MLHQHCSQIVFKQMLECRTVHNLLQYNVTRSFYNNYEAITHFIRYLRKRQIVTEPESTRKWNNPSTRRPKEMHVNLTVPNTYDFLTFNFKEWWEHKKQDYIKYSEILHYKRYVKLGPDLAAAMFVITYGGKARFKGYDEWLDKTKKAEIMKLPTDYDTSYVLEELDLNGYPLRYEHLHFILELYYLKTLNLKGCKTINDWSLDKLSAEFPNLEYLDISECENVTERGIEALYRMPNLKRLIVTNYSGSAAFDLTCFMLEDVNPYLICQIQQPKLKTIPEK